MDDEQGDSSAEPAVSAPTQEPEAGDPGPIGTEPQFRGLRDGGGSREPGDPGRIATKNVAEGERGRGGNG